MLRKLALLSATSFTLFAAVAGDTALDATRYLNDIKFLASPEMHGRATGSPDLERAAQYIAKQFGDDGLKPVGGKGFLEPFQVTLSSKMGRNNKLDFTVKSESQSLQVSKEFVPFNFSSPGKARAPVVFVGYGITAPEYSYDDYAGVDVKDKFVVVLAREPQEYDQKSVFDGKVYTDHAQAYSKAANARKHGAAGVILVNNQIAHQTQVDQLEAFGRTTGPADAGILFVQVKEDVVKGWLKSDGRDLMGIETAIDQDLKPRSFLIPHVEVRENVDVQREVKTVNNVVGYLPGETDEYLIVGAHYDHLGLGEQFSLAPSLAGTVHPGADDNASGTAGVLELARRYSGMPRPKRGILFMTFAGEELGLLGSGYYANHPELPIDKAVAMINMDMIGRVQEGKIYVGGAGTGSTFRKDLDQIAPRFPQLHIDYSDSSGYGSSDHASFTSKQVPVLFFFSGLHSDYHKPSDTWDKINAPAAVDVLKLVASMADSIDAAAVRPTFVRVEEKGNPHSGSSSSTSDSAGGGYGPYFGSIPDFGEVPHGVKFADITPNSPAAKSGLLQGDIMIKFGTEKIENLYDFTYALRAHKPGDEVAVDVMRSGKLVSVMVKLTQRK